MTITQVKPRAWIPGVNRSRLDVRNYWPLWERRGSTIMDVAGGQHGAWNGTGSRWTTDTRGPLITLNGTDDYVDLGNRAGVFPDESPFSVTAWVTRTGAGTEVSARNAVVTNYRSGVGGWTIVWASVLDRWEMYTYGSASQAANTGSNSAAVGELCFLGLVFQGGEVSAYLNGEHKQTTSSGFGYSGTTSWNAKIGGGWSASSPTDFFEGTVGSVGFYRGALSAADMMALYRDPWRPIRRSPSSKRRRLYGGHRFIGDGLPGFAAGHVYVAGLTAGVVHG